MECYSDYDRFPGTHSLNSGVALYFLNSTSHSADDNGGRIPVIGRHSVMLKPDSVRRVTPPTTITAKTKVDDKRSHRPTEGGGNTEGSTGGECEPLVDKGRPCRTCKGGRKIVEYLAGLRNLGMELNNGAKALEVLSGGIVIPSTR
jgi:hypothetical protein